LPSPLGFPPSEWARELVDSSEGLSAQHSIFEAGHEEREAK